MASVGWDNGEGGRAGFGRLPRIGHQLVDAEATEAIPAASLPDELTRLLRAFGVARRPSQK
jgi:hypothetical protein